MADDLRTARRKAARKVLEQDDRNRRARGTSEQDVSEDSQQETAAQAHWQPESEQESDQEERARTAYREGESDTTQGSLPIDNARRLLEETDPTDAAFAEQHGMDADGRFNYGSPGGDYTPLTAEGQRDKIAEESAQAQPNRAQWARFRGAGAPDDAPPPGTPTFRNDLEAERALGAQDQGEAFEMEHERLPLSRHEYAQRAAHGDSRVSDEARKRLPRSKYKAISEYRAARDQLGLE